MTFIDVNILVSLSLYHANYHVHIIY